MYRSSEAVAPVSQTAPAANSTAASPAGKHMLPDGVLASQFSGQDVDDTSPALSTGAAVPVDAAPVQPACVAAHSQPAPGTYSSWAQSSELSVKGLQVKPHLPFISSLHPLYDYT